MGKLNAVIKKVKEKGIKKTIYYCMNKYMSNEDTSNTPSLPAKVYNILLLTNRDSDNVGDQVIEASDLSLLAAVMKNLGVKDNSYEINSRAGAIVSQKYISTGDPQHLKNVRKLIKQSDMVIFGGAPVFNYLYQVFYERTATILEIAEEFHKPVLFSAIGIESYSDSDERCQRLKKTLNFDCVKQVTTRDDFPALEKYIDNTQTVIKKVSDPAVFSAPIFKQFIKPRSKKKIGIFILRANGFVDNDINFTKKESAMFWKNLTCQLKNKGYDYELLTSGHFGDEAFLDDLIRNYQISEKKCVFNMNTPEKLIQKISSYDAVVSCRLHPSIISFALKVPSLGISWNPKVEGFYESVGYGSRVISVENIDPEDVVEKIELAIQQGVDHDQEYLMSVYTSLFNGIKGIICPDKEELVPYKYDELIENLPPYKGTSNAELEEKLKRKFRRTYKMYNERYEKNRQYQKKIKELNSKIQELENR